MKKLSRLRSVVLALTVLNLTASPARASSSTYGDVGGAVSKTFHFVGTTSDGEECTLTLLQAPYLNNDGAAASARVGGKGVPVSFGGLMTKLTHKFTLTYGNWDTHNSLNETHEPCLMIDLGKDKMYYSLTIYRVGTRDQYVRCQDLKQVE